MPLAKGLPRGLGKGNMLSNKQFAHTPRPLPRGMRKSLYVSFEPTYKGVIRCSLNDYQQSPKAIFAERGVLTDARAVLALQLLEQGIAEHSLPLAVDKH